MKPAIDGILAFAVLVFFGGCTSSADVMKTWIGSDTSRLFSSWGVPDRTMELPDGRKVHTWDVRNGYGQIVCTRTFTASSGGTIESFSTTC